jgi:hypothetical protein
VKGFSLKTLIFGENLFKMTVKIELLREDALTLLQYLEQLKVLKVLKAGKKQAPKSPEKKSRFAGRISAETAELLHQQLAEMRNEWK